MHVSGVYLVHKSLDAAVDEISISELVHARTEALHHLMNLQRPTREYHLMDKQKRCIMW